METPCTKICSIDAATKLCAGCGRTTSEITDWSSLSSEVRRRIMAELPARMRQRGMVGGALS